MQRTCSLSLSVEPHTPDVTTDHRVKPGGDAVGSVWSILHVEFESPCQLDASQDEPKIYAAVRRRISIPLQQSLQPRHVRHGDKRMLKGREIVVGACLASVFWVLLIALNSDTSAYYQICETNQYGKDSCS